MFNIANKGFSSHMRHLSSDYGLPFAKKFVVPRDAQLSRLQEELLSFEDLTVYTPNYVDFRNWTTKKLTVYSSYDRTFGAPIPRTMETIHVISETFDPEWFIPFGGATTVTVCSQRWAERQNFSEDEDVDHLKLINVNSNVRISVHEKLKSLHIQGNGRSSVSIDLDPILGLMSGRITNSHLEELVMNRCDTYMSMEQLLVLFPRLKVLKISLRSVDGDAHFPSGLKSLDLHLTKSALPDLGLYIPDDMEQVHVRVSNAVANVLIYCNTLPRKLEVTPSRVRVEYRPARR